MNSNDIPARSGQELIEWLRERYDNCIRIAAQKTGEERDGWLEDAAYFNAAICALASKSSAERTCKACDNTGREFIEKKTEAGDYDTTFRSPCSVCGRQPSPAAAETPASVEELWAEWASENRLVRRDISDIGVSFGKWLLSKSSPAPGKAPIPEEPPTYQCAARKAGTAGGNSPQDCNWPFCGCDPHAEKVLEAIQESGYVIVPEESEMNCTRCTTPILKGERYHRTKKGPHHSVCPHVSVAMPNDGGPAVVRRDDNHNSAAASPKPEYNRDRAKELEQEIALEGDNRFVGTPGPHTENQPPKGQTMNYEAIADQATPNQWRVEAINHAGEGECFVTIFSGPDAEGRAKEYATWKNS